MSNVNLRKQVMSEKKETIVIKKQNKNKHQNKQTKTDGKIVHALASNS